MSTPTATRTGADPDQTARGTKGVLVATAVLGIPQLLFAVFLVGATWVELEAMTPRQRSESWAVLGYFIGAVMAVPPLAATLLGIGAWRGRDRALGLALGIVALCVVGVPALFYLNGLLALVAGG